MQHKTIWRVTTSKSIHLKGDFRTDMAPIAESPYHQEHMQGFTFFTYLGRVVQLVKALHLESKGSWFKPR